MSKVKPRVKVPKTAEVDEVIEIKTLISHPMHSGRAVDGDGNLVPRSEAGAVHSDIARVVNQVVQMANKRPVESLCGHRVELAVQSICVHSDTNNAKAMLQAIQAALLPDAS